MRNAIALAMVVVTAAPLIGIWLGHAWAKSNGMVLRTHGTERTESAAIESSQLA